MVTLCPIYPIGLLAVKCKLYSAPCCLFLLSNLGNCGHTHRQSFNSWSSHSCREIPAPSLTFLSGSNYFGDEFRAQAKNHTHTFAIPTKNKKGYFSMGSQCLKDFIRIFLLFSLLLQVPVGFFHWNE